MKKVNFTLLIGFLIIFLLSSCAVNRKVSYSTVKTDIAVNNSLSYSVATHDQREVVLDGSRDEKFVGYMRSGFAIAYPIGTKSGENFSDEFSNVIKNSLNESSSQTKIIKTNYTDSKQKIFNHLVDSQSDRLLLFTITKWRTDSKPNGMLYGTEVIWNITLEIFDNMGTLLASNQIEGMDPDLDKSMSGSVKKIQRIVDEKFKEKIDLIFMDPEIKAVLSTNIISKKGNLYENDILITQKGEELKVEVIEIGENLIKYRLTSHIEGPVRTIDRKNVFMIKYSNGTKEIFNE